MDWPLIVVIVLAAIGATGVGLMVAAFVLIARQGGWNRAIQQPIAERRWPLARWLMPIGAGLGLVMGLGLVILRLIPGGIPWIN